MTTICQMIKIMGAYNNAIETFIPTFEILSAVLKLLNESHTENTNHLFFSTYTAYFKTIMSHLSPLQFVKLSIFIINFFYWNKSCILYWKCHDLNMQLSWNIYKGHMCKFINFSSFTFHVYYLRQKKLWAFQYFKHQIFTKLQQHYK